MRPGRVEAWKRRSVEAGPEAVSRDRCPRGPWLVTREEERWGKPHPTLWPAAFFSFAWFAYFAVSSSLGVLLTQPAGNAHGRPAGGGRMGLEG